MKIIIANKFYYHRDGVTSYILALEEELKARGHEVRIFTMAGPETISRPESKYFVPFIDFNRKGLLTAWRSLGRIFYSPIARRNFAALIKDFKPDVIHVHNIYHQISPSILSAARRAKVPVVMHLHDYKLLCPNYTLFTRGEVCERCRRHRYYNCLRRRCIKGSLPMSLAATLEMYFHHSIWKVYERTVDLFVAPSKFMKDTCLRFGWPENRIRLLPNFFRSLEAPSDNQTGNHYLYYGRLSTEKGAAVLLKALAETDFRLRIAGKGPQEEELRALAKDLGLDERVSFVGFKQGSDLTREILSARAVIIPSICYDNMPLNMLEAMSLGKIVIASRIGGIPEIIRDGANGLLFEPNDPTAIASKLRSLNDEDMPRLSEAARETVAHLDIEFHTNVLEKLYDECLQKYKRAG